MPFVAAKLFILDAVLITWIPKHKVATEVWIQGVDIEDFDTSHQAVSQNPGRDGWQLDLPSSRCL